jgi:hypothetical protein
MTFDIRLVPVFGERLNCILLSVAVAFSLLFFPSGTTSAQTKSEQRISVSVEHSGDDAVGNLLAYALREQIRRSAAYQYSANDNAVFSIRLVTLDPSSENTGNSCVAAVTMTMANFIPFKKDDPQTYLPIYLTTIAMTVGRKMVEEQAVSIVASLDKEIDGYRRLIGSKNVDASGNGSNY